MGIGFFLLGQATALYMVFLAVPFIGFSAGILMPSLLLAVPKVVTPEARAFAMAIISCAVFFGQFISPIILKTAATLFGRHSIGFNFSFLSAALMSAAVIGLLIVSKNKNLQPIPQGNA
jgi:MFS family permease